QKTYREAFSRNPKRNKGQRNKYIIENAHEPIVTKEYFDLVLHEKERRYQLMSQESHLNKGIFRDKISCSECGCLMIVKVDSK
ncbi:recombinase family protein, partial [Streptococcus dysgalactiae]